MDTRKQIEFCKKCTKQKFDFKQGIICGLTNQKADFENECDHFEIDKEILASLLQKRESSNKGKIATGFSPKNMGNLPIPELDNKQALVIAFETAHQLNWNIGTISEVGFFAYTGFSWKSFGEEIQVSIEVGNIHIKSELTGSQIIDWGKNRKNIAEFIALFKQLQVQINLTDLHQRYTELLHDFVSEDNQDFNPPLAKKAGVSGLLSMLTPSKGYFITPLIVIINIFIFLVMVFDGVHIIMPTIDSLLIWGANFRPSTITGEWWRLITSTFIHIGIFHLLVNMYALIFIGLLLEPYLGSARYLSAYFIAGIAGSVASIFWHELTVSAGASGAIFGMYGVFIALLTTKMIEKSARQSLLFSIGAFVLYNLANGLKDGIDNAAHIGGLISGLIIGYAYYPSLIKSDKRLMPLTIAGLVLVFSLGAFGLIRSLPNDYTKYSNEMNQFEKLELKALRFFDMPANSTKDELLKELEYNGLPSWEESLKHLQTIDTYALPQILLLKNDKLKEYCELRIKSFQAIQRAISEETNKYDYEIEYCNIQIDKILNELTSPQ